MVEPKRGGRFDRVAKRVPAETDSALVPPKKQQENDPAPTMKWPAKVNSKKKKQTKSPDLMPWEARGQAKGGRDTRDRKKVDREGKIITKDGNRRQQEQAPGPGRIKPTPRGRQGREVPGR